MAEYESPVDNGIPRGDTSDTAREFNSSDRARARPLESQFGELGIEDLPNFFEEYCEKEKQVYSLQAENDKLITENDKLFTENDKLITDYTNLQAENMRLYCESINFSCENLQRKLQSGKVRANDNEDGNNSAEDDENSNQVSSSCRTLNYVSVSFEPALC